jgi:sarcosine oxidase subunit beta
MKLERLWSPKPIKPSYDAIMIGGGIHGLATAYFLAKEHGINNVAVIERRFVGYGGSCRNTAIVRANQRSQSNVALYDEGLKLWPKLIDELDFNMMFHNCGNLNTAHSEAALNASRLAVTTAQFCGVKSELLDRKQCKELIPALNMSEDITYPVFGGMYHPPGGILRHDGVTWGLAKGAAKHGVDIHQLTELKQIKLEGGKVAGIVTDKGEITSPKVLICAGGYGNAIAHQLGIKLPIHPLTIQAMVTQPLKPFLHHVVSSGAYHVYANQTLKGEVATGAHMDAWPNYTTNTTAHLSKAPGRGAYRAAALHERESSSCAHWAGLADMTTDMAPIMDGNYPIEGLYLDVRMGLLRIQIRPHHRQVHGPVHGQGRASGHPGRLQPEAL